MRGYLAVTPQVLSEFLEQGSFLSPHAFVTTRYFFEEFPDVDEEEREFELSLLASAQSRQLQKIANPLGFVLAVDLTSAQTGSESGAEIELLSPILWTQVESLLVSESEEDELTWFASQEIADHLGQWLA